MIGENADDAPKVGNAGIVDADDDPAEAVVQRHDTPALGTPLKELDATVKGPEQVRKLFPRPVGARPRVQKPPAKAVDTDQTGPEDAQNWCSGGDGGAKLGQGIAATVSATRNPSEAPGSGASEADSMLVIPLDALKNIVGQSALPQKIKEYMPKECGAG